MVKLANKPYKGYLQHITEENRKFFIDIKNQSDIITTKYRLMFKADKKLF